MKLRIILLLVILGLGVGCVRAWVKTDLKPVSSDRCYEDMEYCLNQIGWVGIRPLNEVIHEPPLLQGIVLTVEGGFYPVYESKEAKVFEECMKEKGYQRRWVVRRVR